MAQQLRNAAKLSVRSGGKDAFAHAYNFAVDQLEAWARAKAKEWRHHSHKDSHMSGDDAYISLLEDVLDDLGVPEEGK